MKAPIHTGVAVDAARTQLENEVTIQHIPSHGGVGMAAAQDKMKV